MTIEELRMNAFMHSFPTQINVRGTIRTIETFKSLVLVGKTKSLRSLHTGYRKNTIKRFHIYTSKKKYTVQSFSQMLYQKPLHRKNH